MNPVCTICSHETPFAGLLNMIETSDELITQDEDIERASRSLKAMSHPLRLKILCTLGDQEVSVQDIVEHVGTSQSNISQHLAILRDKGILASRKDANRVCLESQCWLRPPRRSSAALCRPCRLPVNR